MNTLKRTVYEMPILGSQLWKLKLRKNFPAEIALLKGKHKSRSNHRSIIHFSLTKSAITFVKAILNRIGEENGLTKVNIHDYANQTNLPFLDSLKADEMGKYKHVFKEKGYLYSVFGGMVENIDRLENYLILFMIRDPRDILVSSYFSNKYSHPQPLKTFNKYKNYVKARKVALDTPIDDYVIASSDSTLAKITRYINLLIDQYPHVYVTKYSEMVGDFPKWLDKLTTHLDLPLSHSLREELIRKYYQNKPSNENKKAHNRKGVVGDFREKLKPETIEYLNKKFLPVLDKFNFQI